jgi:hypothetical protein
MGVRAHDEARAPVAEMAHRHLFGRRLGMDVDEDRLRHAAARIFLQRRIEGRERIVEGPFHEDLAQRLRDEDLAPARVLEEPRPLPRRVLGEVERAQDARLAPDELQHVALVEGVIAQRDHIGPGLEQGLGMRRRQPRAGGRVLAVDHDEIEAPGLPQVLQVMP